MIQIDLDKIRTIRDAKGYSQEYMAELLGISKNAYGKIERGETKPSLHRLEQIASALDLSLEQLLGNQVVIYQVNQDNTSSSNIQTYAADGQEMALVQQENLFLKEKVAILERENALQKKVIDEFLSK
jgi:transcriptional regulator with XRE-family HTH domain